MPEECNNGGMNRRDFLKGATTVGMFLIPNISLSLTNTEPAKGAVYETAKKVYDLAKKAWIPERENYFFYGAGVEGILNLASTGPDHDGQGYYLKLRRCDLGSRTQLELTAVGGYINKETTREIDNHLNNLKLIHTPTLEGIDQNLLEFMYGMARGRVTSTVIAVNAIWQDKILSYARKNNFPVLELSSWNLTNLHYIGFGEDGQQPNISDGTTIVLEDTYVPNLKDIIIQKYLPLLDLVIPQLEREVKRVNDLRSDKSAVEKEKKLEEKLLLERKHLVEAVYDYDNSKPASQKPSPSLVVQKILEYPVP